MASWLDGLRDRLVTAGIGKKLSDPTLLATSVAISVNFLPDDHDRAVALFSDSGREPTQVHDKPGISTFRPRLRAWCRHDRNARSSAEDLALSVMSNLALVRNVSIGGFWFHSIWPTGNPTEVLTDDQGRPIFLTIFDVERNA
jgi:hypothetical protein